MGIQNLLPNLKSIMDQKHIAEYAGKKVGIDAYAWLHRSSYTCAQEMCLGQPSTKWLDWCVARCEMLRHFKVIPVLVFDGGRLPEKDKTEAGRRESRQRSRARALEMLAAGDRSGAFKMFQKAVDITPAIARTLMAELRRRQIEFINAPYEADAQLAYLSQTGYIVAVITEDSDLLAFGCARVFYKMDKDGHGCEVRLKNLGATTELNFTGWTHEMFQQMCIFAGCDYLESLPNVGIKKAHAYIAQNKTWERALRRIRLDGKTIVPREYDREFELALMTFKHQRVYDPHRKKLVHLSPVDETFAERFQDAAFLGADLPEEVACAIAEGRYDPDTKAPFVEVQTMPTTAPATDIHQHPGANRIAPPPVPHSAHTPLRQAASAYSAAAAVPRLSDLLSTKHAAPPRHAFDTQPSIGGWAKKHSTSEHHAQPPAGPIERAVRYSTGGTILTTTRSAEYTGYASENVALSLTQQKVLATCGDLLHSSEDIVSAAAAVPAAFRGDFRAPRKNEPKATTTTMRDVTNIDATTSTMTSAHFAATQPTPASKSLPGWKSARAPPSTAPNKLSATSSNRAERERALDVASHGGRYRSSASTIIEMIDVDEEALGIGYTEEDAAAEIEIEQTAATAVGEEEDEAFEDPTTSFLPPPPPKRKLKMNFFSRSHHHTSIATLSTSIASPPPSIVQPRQKLTIPSAVPLTFSSPPAFSQSPSPPPAPTTMLSSKYFASSNRMPRASAAAAAASSSSSAAAARIPDASCFLTGASDTGVGIPTTFASEVEDENEGRIDVDDMAFEDDPHSSLHQPSSHRLRRTGVKRASTTGMSASEMKRARSGGSAARLTLSNGESSPTMLGVPTCVPPAIASMLTPVRRASESTSQVDSPAAAAGAADDVNSPGLSSGLDPITAGFVSARSRAAAQPFKHLTVQPRSPRTSAAAAEHRPPRHRVAYEYAVGFSSPPVDDDTPPSPTPSPVPLSGEVDGSPASAAAAVSPSPPAVSQAFAGPFAAAGFSSQPSDEEGDDDMAQDEGMVAAAAAPFESSASAAFGDLSGLDQAQPPSLIEVADSSLAYVVST